jgi:hypothetical protein
MPAYSFPGRSTKQVGDEHHQRNFGQVDEMTPFAWKERPRAQLRDECFATNAIAGSALTGTIGMATFQASQLRA